MNTTGKAQHITPGPWASNEYAYVTARDGEDLVADCFCLNGLNEADSFANARLIAFTPEMANKLKDCCERLCESCSRGVEHPDSHCGAADIRQLLKKAGVL